MFGILSRRRRQSSTPRPVNRARLQCEQLGERVNPTTTGSFSAGFAQNGTFTYDETQIDWEAPTDTVTLNNLGFSYGTIHYTADSAPVANFAYGQFVSVYDIEMSPNISGPPHLSIDVVGTTATVVSNYDTEHPQTYDINLNFAVKTSITLDFATIKTGVAYTLTIVIKDKDGQNMTTVETEVTANQTAQQIRDAVAAALSAEGIDFETESTGATQLKIKQQNGVSAQSFEITAVDPNDDYVPGPKLIARQGVPTVIINGDSVTPGN